MFQARVLTEVWEAADGLAGRPLPAPFWAYAWPGGAALARVLLDHPDWVRGQTVLDVGCGGGVTALAAARAGAARVLANDEDPWALAVARLASQAQGLSIEPLPGDLAAAADARTPAAGGLDGIVPHVDVALAGDLGYERSGAPRIHRLLKRLSRGGARALVADAGRVYFDDAGLDEVATFTVDVPKDLEGTAERTVTVYRL